MDRQNFKPNMLRQFKNENFFKGSKKTLLYGANVKVLHIDILNASTAKSIAVCLDDITICYGSINLKNIKCFNDGKCSTYYQEKCPYLLISVMVGNNIDIYKVQKYFNLIPYNSPPTVD